MLQQYTYRQFYRQNDNKIFAIHYFLLLHDSWRLYKDNN